MCFGPCCERYGRRICRSSVFSASGFLWEDLPFRSGEWRGSFGIVPYTRTAGRLVDVLPSLKVCVLEVGFEAASKRVWGVRVVEQGPATNAALCARGDLAVLLAGTKVERVLMVARVIPFRALRIPTSSRSRVRIRTKALFDALAERPVLPHSNSQLPVGG